MPRQISFIADKSWDGKTLLSFLRGKMQMSTRLIRTLKRVENGILINGAHARTVDILHEGNTVTISLPQDGVCPSPSGCTPDICYEDDDILVVNKSGYMPMHPSHNHQGDTLANAVSAYLQKKDKSGVFRAIGRLDKGTSGLVLCALNKYSAARLSGNIKKTYLAVVRGVPAGMGTIEAPIYRPDPLKTLRDCGENGEYAKTNWQLISSDGETSLLKVSLETGRTHQIRVHFAHIGFPLLGDSMYGTADLRIKRHALHAAQLSFVHPESNKKIEISADLPEDMRDLNCIKIIKK